MPTNPYVRLWDDTNEQNLINDLMTEAIGMYGVDVIYLPRTMRREDTLYMEDVLSQFTQTYPIEVYVQSTGGWEGAGNFLNKFGLQIEHTVSVMLSRRRFSELIPLSRPTEGDWVYFPAPINKLFEIKFVENEKAAGQFYPLGTRTYYQLSLELYTYSHEEIRTTIPEINTFEMNEAYAQLLVLTGGGSGTYTDQETVYQGLDLASATATGVVAGWNEDTKELKITDITGTFLDGSVVVGTTSGASYTLGATPDPKLSPNDPTHDNKYYETAYPAFIDTSERDPLAGLP